MFSGGDRFKICGFFDFTRYGRHIFETMKVPRMFIWCIKSYFFIEVSRVGVKLIADALFTKISIPPKVCTTFWMQSVTFFSSRISHCKGSALAPRSYIYLAAVNIVPGSLGFSVVLLASMATLAPSFAHAFAIAKPIPLEPPVITTVFPFNGFSVLDTWCERELSLFILTYIIRLRRWCHKLWILRIPLINFQIDEELLGTRNHKPSTQSKFPVT